MLIQTRLLALGSQSSGVSHPTICSTTAGVSLASIRGDVETTGELTAGETVGYSPVAGDLRRRPGMEKDAAASMQIRGSAPTLASLKSSPVVRDKWVPNAKVAVEVDSARFFDLLIGRLSGSGQHF